MSKDELEQIHIKSGLRQVVVNEWWANQVPPPLQRLFERTGLMAYSFDLPRHSEDNKPLFTSDTGFVWTRAGYLALKQVRQDLAIEAAALNAKRLEAVA